MKKLFASFLRLSLLIVLLAGTFLQPQPVQAAIFQPQPVSTSLLVNPSGDLRIEPITAYNLVVDSNVLSPSTYAPESATLGAKFCNDGSNAMTNVFAYIGDYNANPTPGIYPSRNSSDAAFIAEHLHLANTGSYSLTHEGGSAGLRDATRFVGTLAPGECRTEYWLISYPRTNPAGTVSVTGGSIKPDDDLWLEYDFWATANDGGTPFTADVTTKVTMRNEISAAANKIWPNGDNKVPQQYLDAIAVAFGWDTLTPGGGSTAYPGQLVTTQGIWYDLGNVGFGFDNNGDLVPDHNAWLQPIGIPSAFDPGCFRLVRTYGIVIVKLVGGGEYLIPFEDDMYFENIPDNTGTVGLVFYEYAAMNGACTAGLTPYQEVASGYDNEKFNGDFGYGIPPLQSVEPQMSLVKSDNPDPVAVGNFITYTLLYTNPSQYSDGQGGFVPAVTVGNPDLGTPLVVNDSIPAGTCYLAGSADDNAPSTEYTILYSTDSGTTWSITEPGDTNPANGCNDTTDIQWWRLTSLPPNTSDSVTFSVTVPASYTPPLVPNTGCLSFGSSACFLDANTTTLVSGALSISGTVFCDDGPGETTSGPCSTVTTDAGTLANSILDAGGGEPGMPNVRVELYFDANGNGTVDSGDSLLSFIDTIASGAYTFSNLRAGNYVVKVVKSDPDVQSTYGITTPETRDVTLVAANVTGLDFGFAPPLSLEKSVNRTTGIGGDLFTYTITLNNNLPGNGTPGGFCTYYVWAGQANPNQTGVPPSGNNANTRWQNITNATGRPDGLVAYTVMNDATDVLGLTNFNIADMGGNITGVSYRMYVNERLNLDDDQLDVGIFDSAVSTTTAREIDSYTYLTTFTGGTGTKYIIDGTITYVPTGGWNFSQFSSSSNRIGLQLTGNRVGGSSGDLDLDAAAFIITTDQICSGADSALNPVPLTDVFRNDHFAFVSADPPVSSTSTVGTDTTLTWSNVGPIYPGGTKTVTVTLRALNPVATVNSTDTATSANARFANGTSANTPVTDQATVTINPNASTRSVTGTIFDDNNINGWQGGAWTVGGAQVGYDAGDTFIQNAIVNLYACVNPATGVLVFNANNNRTCAQEGGEWLLYGTTLTNASGVYTFSGLGRGYYYVQVDAVNSIAGTQTADVNQAGVCTACDSRSNDPSGNGGTEDLEDTTFVVNLDNATTAITRVNFGYNVPSGTNSTIGDLIYFDWNGDGAFTAGVDEGIDGVTVELLNPAGTVVATQVTTDGAYLFTGLSAGVYTVRVSSATLPTYVTQTVDPDQSGVCTVCDNRSVSTVNGTNSDLTRDFGYYPYGTGQIGDTVWRDMNADGTQLGFLETGIPNITVSLQADFNGDGTWVTIATDITDSNGNYLFENLPDGTYRVVVDSADTDLPNDAFGQDYDPTTATTLTVVMSGGVVTSIGGSACTNCDLNSDFGFGPLGVIGDTIFWDANADGEQDYTESGVPGVTINLYRDANGNGLFDTGEALVATDVTDANGKYLFTGIPTDADGEKYVVVVTTASGPLAGRTLTADPNADGLSCITTPEPWAGFYSGCDSQVGSGIYPGTAYMGADFGYLPGAVIGDTVWIDSDGDGVRDGTETGIGFVTVRLCTTPACATVNGTTETDADGNYYFTEVANGTYYVVVDTADGDFPSGVTPTYNDPDDTTVNNVTRVVVSGGNVTEVGDDADPTCTNCGLTVDFGYRYVGTNDLNGTVCLENSSVDGVCDTDASGVGANESAYNNVTVYLYLWTDDGDSNVEPGETVQVGSTQTDSNGDYAFNNIASGTYVISMGAPQSNLHLTTTQALVGAPTTRVVETASGGYTASVYQVVTVGGDVNNRDFAFRTDPKDYGDLPVTYSTLINNSPTGPSHTVPATPSLYLGPNAPDTETNGQPTADATGDGSDEDGIVPVGIWGNGTYNAVNGTGGAVNVTVNGSGYLMGWIDFNRDGDFTDSGELIISQSVVTGTAGYTFNVPANTFAGPGDPTNLTLYSRFRLFESQPLFPSLAYAGAAGNGEVEDYAFRWVMTIDKDTSTATVTSNGTVTYTVTLVNTGNQTLTNVQATDILPDFNGAVAGKGYAVTNVTATGGLTVNFPGFNGDTVTTLLNGSDSLTAGTTSVITITLTLSNASNATYDNTASASSTQTGTIDDDGTTPQDADTPSGSDPETDEDVTVGSTGTLVMVKNAIPDGAQDFAYTVTGTGLTPFSLDDDADATLPNTQTFSSLTAGGTYTVNETVVASWSVTNITCTGATSSTVTIGASGGFDAGDTSVSVQLAAGETVTCTFENTQLATVSGHLYIDTNGNGTQDVGEPDLANVNVLVTDANGNTQTVVTNANGDWTATVPLGSTTANVDETDPDYPAGYTQTEGTDPTTVTAVAGANTSAGNDGYYLGASIGDTVFLDDGLGGGISGNGIQDGGESGIGGITVYVDIDSSGTFNAGDLSDTTDSNGNYSITNIPPGNYNVRVSNPPVGYILTTANDPTNVTLAAGDIDNTIDFGYLGERVDLSLTKTVDISSPPVASQITFTLTVTNSVTSTVPATGVVVTDVIPAGFTYISSATLTGSYNNATGEWTLTNPLPIGGSASLGITVIVNVPGPYTNYAEITRADQVDPDSTPNNGSTNEDDDDNVTVTPTQSNPTLGKTVSGSNQVFTTGTNVAIGEIIEYSVTINVPPGIYANAQLVDTMERGLSFMTCSTITVSNPALTTDVAGSFTGACSNPTVNDAGGGTTVDVGRRVTFDLGTLTNASGADQTLTITYTAVVLDSAGNVVGVSLDNSAVWTSGAVAQPPAAASVTIVEPDLSISKTANTTLVSIGSEVTITLEIRHTGVSNTDAFDAVVTDALPVEVDLVPGTLECVSGAQDANTCVYDAGTRTINAVWNSFTRTGGNGLVTFRVRIVTLPPSGISNIANVAWTSLPGNVGTPQNTNVFSTERGYDPASQIDVYGASNTLVLNVFGNNNGNNAARSSLLPATGFAPNVETDLSNIKKENYVQTAGLTVEIPSLGINLPIVGVPLKNGEWNVSWLGNQAGWLEGSAFPSWSGNSVLTSHVYGSNGRPGPFVNLGKLKYGDKIIVHAYGRKYTYEVRANSVVEPNDTTVFKHEEKAWLTLVTCKEYDEKTNTYKKRVVVRAVLVGVDWE